jgi:homoserine O-acetyltransferase/O-succinyltransferase
MDYFYYRDRFFLESGETLPELVIGYHTYGTLNAAGDNVIWICHALTANSDVAEWWPGMVGKGCIFDTDRYFIVCANILGSCYGTTGPLEINPLTHTPYFGSFPQITIRDMVKAHQLLATHLSISGIYLMVGGSMGGYQALEWCLMEPEKIERLFLIATSARESAWGIAVHSAQRMAIEADCTWNSPSPHAARNGLKAARAIGMLTYRGYQTYQLTQQDHDPEKTDHFKATSYIYYQGEKLANRFNAYSYWFLTKAMDSHNIARGRTISVEEALHKIGQRTLIIAIASDILCPIQELELLSHFIPDSQYRTIESNYGHDGFLVETKAISEAIARWWV